MKIKPILAYETFQEQDITPLFNFNYCSFFFGCGGPVKERNKNSATANSVSWGHVASEKYTIDTKESVLPPEQYVAGWASPTEIYRVPEATRKGETVLRVGESEGDVPGELAHHKHKSRKQSV
ncbi:hypothetical protein KK062_09160 [Fulvivirgaceae bacterium PWU5]|uniref:Uncharacterized protein n=1 Tax=Dawidia cretensis TaxID=2782350 RepID=A0AAP2DVZ6_9BACT|nr:hypothetical protein [Dawidia cretensis]MBT1708391.1 hypothetical protein [Dawidia cretensis]